MRELLEVVSEYPWTAVGVGTYVLTVLYVCGSILKDTIFAYFSAHAMRALHQRTTETKEGQ